MATFSSSASLEKGCRIILVDIYHAKLKPEKKGKYYVDISIRKGRGLPTKLAVCLGGGHSPSWYQKFVFSVPKQFIFDEGSSVSFTILRTRKFLPEIVVGKATSEMKELFPIKVENSKKDHENSRAHEAKYDTEEEEEGCDDNAEQTKVPEKENFRLVTSVRLPILKGSSMKGELNVSITTWEKYYAEEQLNWNGREQNVYQIYRRLDHLGSLCMEKALEDKHVSCVGNAGWQNLAMEYEEFTMEKEAKKSRPKISLLACASVFSHTSKD